MDSAIKSRMKANRAARQLLLLAARLNQPELATIASRAIELTSPCSHSIDFACINWYGKLYTFTNNQAPVMRLLWENWQAGTPWVKQQTLLVETDSEAANLHDVFKRNDAWGEIIEFENGRARLKEIFPVQ